MSQFNTASSFLLTFKICLLNCRLKQKQKLKEKHQKTDNNSSKHDDKTSSDEEAEEEIDLDEKLEGEPAQIVSEASQK